MIQNALFRQCLAAIPEEQKAEFELKFGTAARRLRSKGNQSPVFSKKIGDFLGIYIYNYYLCTR